MHGKSIHRQHHSHECSVRLCMSAHNHMQQICSHLPTWQRDMKSRAMSEQEPKSGPGRGCHNAASSSEALASRRGSCCWAHHGHQPLLLLLQLPLACAPQYNILHACFMHTNCTFTAAPNQFKGLHLMSSPMLPIYAITITATSRLCCWYNCIFQHVTSMHVSLHAGAQMQL